ncbi:protein O-linked-mannose beta-1,2-N-acetylglucosaminyltransferase 1-like [Panulirus ornatus]|uniref:protein O-linked-mannose beta-1,2-N-acetylglucosaminyltransferase 1-like n=1 Tax=Panulirus ornatus TaxID=150431 RepID=UPI003A879D56
MTGVTVAVNDQQVYSVLNITKIWKIGPVRLHAGIHLITLHQVTGQVMAANSYMTWQTGTDRQLLEDFQHIQDGRLLVILGAPDFTTFLEETTITWLMTELGGLYIDSLAYKDVWCLVVHKGGRVVLEALTTSLPGRDMEKLEVSPLQVQTTVPRGEEQRCGWHGRAGMEERATFCDTYEGYGNFCSCHYDDLPWSPLPHNILEYQVQEVIPVAIVTAHRLPHVLRQVSQLWSSPGGTITPITIFVDGHSPEARALASLLNLPVVEHHNPAPLGRTSRISSHVKSVLSRVFEQYLEADKAIILEDDLDLSVDFIPYFHQTATLLTSDPMLVCVNAYNYNAFSHTALDPTRLYRFHGIPAYGWMVRREVAKEMVQKWAPLNETLDWDWWLRYHMMGERDILVPEIPRTKHRGSGGVHVTGLEQVYYYDQRPLNTRLNVTIDIKRAELTNYLDFHYDAIRNGQVLHLSNHPCKDLPLPRHPVNQSYVLYVSQPDESKSSLWPYYVAARCVGFNDHNFHENLQMMFTASFYGNQLYIVTCPHSPFCLTEDPTNIFNVTMEDVRYAIHHPFRKHHTFMHVATRVPPLSFSDEIYLTNLVHATVEVFMSESV